MDDVLPLQELGRNYSETARFTSQKCAQPALVAIDDLSMKAESSFFLIFHKRASDASTHALHLDQGAAEVVLITPQRLKMDRGTRLAVKTPQPVKFFFSSIICFSPCPLPLPAVQFTPPLSTALSRSATSSPLHLCAARNRFTSPLQNSDQLLCAPRRLAQLPFR